MDQKSNPQNPGPQKPKKQSSSEGSLESGFNLVSTAQQFYVVPKYASKLMTIIRDFIIILSVSFGVMLVINFASTTIIDFQKNLQKQLSLEVDTYAGVEEKAKKIDAKTLAYKKFSNERELLLDKTKFVLDNIGANITLKSLNIDHSRFAITFSGKTALDFTNLILNYLEKDMLAEIVLRSASFDKSKEQYNVTLEGTFK